MSILQTLRAAFKGGAQGRVPLGRGFASPWAEWAFVHEPGGTRLPFEYRTAVQRGYLDNPVAQRAVRLVAEGIAGAPLLPAEPALGKLVAATSAGQALLETLASHLLLHGIPRPGSTAWACSPPRSPRSAGRRRCPPAMACGRTDWPAPRRRPPPADSARRRGRAFPATCCCSGPDPASITWRSSRRPGAWFTPMPACGVWLSRRNCPAGRCCAAGA